MLDVFTISFIAYLVVVVAFALVAYRFTANLSDFVLGGRSLGGPVAALSAGASDMSAWLLLGLPGAAYTFGFSQIWLPIGLTIGAYLNWLIIAKPLRVYTEVANDSLTLPAFLDNRLRDKGHRIRLISALATLVFFAVYTTSGLAAGALLMESSFGLPYSQALLIGTTIIVGYTFVGGFLAVSWTDFFQGNFMFLCMLFVPVAICLELGGVRETANIIHSLDPNYLDPLAGITLLGTVNLLAWGLGYFGQPHILVRFMAVRSLKDIPVARRIAMAWMIFSLIGAVLTGIVGIAYFKGSITNPESVFITFANVIFSPAISGLILAAILSSIMCAIDSQMLASTSALTEDIYHPFIRPKATQKELVWVGRLSLIAIAAVAVTITWYSDKGVLDLVSFAWAGLASSFAAPVVFSLFYRKMTSMGAIVGMLAGSVTVIVWATQAGGVFELYEIIPGIGASIIGVLLGLRFGAPPSEEQMLEFDEVRQRLQAE